MSKKSIDLAAYDIIRKPLITEKSTSLSEQNKVVFQVAQNATKETVKKAVEALFDVKVTKVNILNMKGKRRGFRGRAGVRSDIKKAIVTLEAGKAVDLLGGVR